MLLLPFEYFSKGGGRCIICALGSFKLLIEGFPVFDPRNAAECELLGILLYFEILSEIEFSINLDCYDEF